MIQDSSSNNTQQFVDWFRSASPYIHAHHGRTFVICFGGEAVLILMSTFVLQT